jgi:hypothetical protein
MAKYNVRLVNPWKMWFKREQVMHEVASLFRPVAEAAKFEDVNVTATLALPTLMPSDVLVYLLPNEGYSLLEKAFGEGGGDPAGRTVVEYGASEVYIAGPTSGSGGVSMRIDHKQGHTATFEFVHDPPTIAKVVFHEVLHNKLKMSDAQLHNQKGPGNALFRKELLPHSKRSAEDTALLAKVLGKTRPQWTKGWNYLP